MKQLSGFTFWWVTWTMGFLLLWVPSTQRRTLKFCLLTPLTLKVLSANLLACLGWDCLVSLLATFSRSCNVVRLFEGKSESQWPINIGTGKGAQNDLYKALVPWWLRRWRICLQCVLSTEWADQMMEEWGCCRVAVKRASRGDQCTQEAILP